MQRDPPDLPGGLRTVTKPSVGEPDQAFPDTDGPYVIVFAGDSSRLFRLPCSGEVTMGRAEDTTLPLPSASVSRRHARIDVRPGGAWICDLESHNGTAVNGARIEQPVRLASGDVVSLGEVTLVFRARTAFRAHDLLDSSALLSRLDEEVERAAQHDRPLTLLVLRLADDRDLSLEPAASVLRRIDVVGRMGPGELAVILPELAAGAAHGLAARLVAALSPSGRAGIASCPRDGCDAETLLACARSATHSERPGAVSEPSIHVEVLQVGDRNIVIADAAMARIYALVRRLAPAELPVLVHGETGSGKDLVAAAVHYWSHRAERPFVAINCAALQDTLVESELFGFARGAFSGAVAAKPGLFEAGTGGTVLLDEVGELSAATQAKLLRVLETKRATRLGEIAEREIDVRIVAATNRNLEQDVRDGRFREDLYYRLSAATIWLPPLRDRPTELRVLSERFVVEACTKARREPLALGESAIRVLAKYPWPGNLRELRNTMEYLAATVHEAKVEDFHLPERLLRGRDTELGDSTSASRQSAFRPIEDEIREIERRRMAAALAASSGNHARAAALISMPLRTFYSKAKQYGLGRKEGP